MRRKSFANRDFYLNPQSNKDMPELPELAIYAENLRPRVVGKAITAVKVDHSVAFKKIIAEEFVRRVTEHTVWDVVRRGKTLGFSLDSGDRIDVH